MNLPMMDPTDSRAPWNEPDDTLYLIDCTVELDVPQLPVYAPSDASPSELLDEVRKQLSLKDLPPGTSVTSVTTDQF